MSSALKSIVRKKFLSDIALVALVASTSTFGVIVPTSAQATVAAAPCAGVRTMSQIPRALAVDGQGFVYSVEGGDGSNFGVVRKISPSNGLTTIIAGLRKTKGFGGDNGPAIDARIDRASGIAANAMGDLFIADRNNHRIRKIDHATQIISTIPADLDGVPALGDGNPWGIAVAPNDDIYFTIQNENKVNKIDHLSGLMTTVAGTGVEGFFGDNGPAINAKLRGPQSVAVSASGDVYIADTNNQRIRKINHTTNVITTVVGNGSEASGAPVDNVSALETPMNYPMSIALDATGNLFIGDQSSLLIRRVDNVSGVIKTLGGITTKDGFDFMGLAIGASGLLYVAEYNGTISRMNQTSGLFTKITGGADGSSDDYPDLCNTSIQIVEVAAGTAPNSQVATIPTGLTTASIPATASLPATTLNFGGTVPTSVTVVPVLTNPAASSATPFTISDSTKIVDIQVSDGFSGTATVCLEGSESDHIFHYTGGAWVELPSRSYIDGQVCGVTDSFSPFAAAPPAAALRSTSAAEAAAIAAAAAAKREAEIKAARNEISNKLAKSQSLTLDSFKKAEISGVTAENFTAVQAEILALPIESRAEISQVLKIARKYEVVGKIASNQASTLPISAFVEAGLLTAENKNKTTLIAAVKQAPESERSSFALIQVVIAEAAAKIKERKDRLTATISRIKSR